jgi:hypothetical protein
MRGVASIAVSVPLLTCLVACGGTAGSETTSRTGGGPPVVTVKPSPSRARLTQRGAHVSAKHLAIVGTADTYILVQTPHGGTLELRRRPRPLDTRLINLPGYVTFDGERLGSTVFVRSLKIVEP